MENIVWLIDGLNIKNKRGDDKSMSHYMRFQFRFSANKTEQIAFPYQLAFCR